jgi:biopolymer transport protein ExbD
MSRRHHYRRRTKENPELDVTTFLNLMVVLVPFLLITAVFSRITVVELNLPASASDAQAQAPEFRLEVIVRDGGLEIGNGEQVIAAIPKMDDGYDLETLSSYMVSLKEDNPDSEAASVLLEPDIPYDYLIQVMDAVRSVVVPADKDDDEPFVRLALFPEISIGEAP